MNTADTASLQVCSFTNTNIHLSKVCLPILYWPSEAWGCKYRILYLPQTMSTYKIWHLFYPTFGSTFCHSRSLLFLQILIFNWWLWNMFIGTPKFKLLCHWFSSSCLLSLDGGFLSTMAMSSDSIVRPCWNLKLESKSWAFWKSRRVSGKAIDTTRRNRVTLVSG